MIRSTVHRRCFNSLTNYVQRSASPNGSVSRFVPLRPALGANSHPPSFGRFLVRSFSSTDGEKSKKGEESASGGEVDDDLASLLGEKEGKKEGGAAASGTTTKGERKANEEGSEGEEGGDEDPDLTMPYAAIAAAIAAAVGSLSFVGYWLYSKRALLDALAMSRMDLGYVIFTAYKKSVDILRAEPAVTTRLGGRALVAEESTLKMHQTEDTASALFALFGPRGRASVDLSLRAVPDSSFNKWELERITVDFLNGEVIEFELTNSRLVIADRRGYRELESSQGPQIIDWLELSESLAVPEAK
mmetsp:Transcript_3911/g.12667  ORF Transcript_3911/g.12667 Transcript_3911/m.12667 type:complete len:302 (-) Transcript_3911:191-1096(-)